MWATETLCAGVLCPEMYFVPVQMTEPYNDPGIRKGGILDRNHSNNQLTKALLDSSRHPHAAEWLASQVGRTLSRWRSNNEERGNGREMSVISHDLSIFFSRPNFTSCFLVPGTVQSLCSCCLFRGATLIPGTKLVMWVKSIRGIRCRKQCCALLPGPWHRRADYWENTPLVEVIALLTAEVGSWCRCCVLLREAVAVQCVWINDHMTSP